MQLYPDDLIVPAHILENIRSISASAGFSEDSMNRHSVKPVRGGQGKRANLSRQELLQALEQCRGNRSEAAQLLGIARRTLYRYLEKYQMIDT